MSFSRNPSFLDIDPSIIEKNLLLDETRERDEKLDQLFPAPVLPSLLVRPTPGFCIKIRKTDDTKVFINVCQTDAIPPPRDVTEEELSEILRSDIHGDYRVPMSLGNPRQEPDKSGKPADVYDVAVNSVLLKKVDGSLLFRSFLLQIIFEGVQQKYEIEFKLEEYVILKNRKSMGTLQQHRIQQRDIEQTKNSKPLIQEMPNSSSCKPGELETTRLPLKPSSSGSGDAERLHRTVHTSRQPQYRLFQEPSTGEAKFLIGEFTMPEVKSFKELTLDVGEDRIILEGRRQGYLLDVFVPFKLDQSSTCAQFNKDTSLLTVTMPVIGV